MENKLIEKIRESFYHAADYIAKNFSPLYSEEIKSRDERIGKLEEKLKEAISQLDFFTEIIKKERKEKENYERNYEQKIIELHNLLESQKEEINNLKIQRDKAIQKAKNEHTKQRLIIDRAVRDLRELYRKISFPYFAQGLARLSPDELKKINVSQGLVESVVRLKEERDKLEIENLDLKAASFAFGASCLVEYDSRFAKAPTAVYDIRGRKLHETKRFLKFSSEIEKDLKETFSNEELQINLKKGNQQKLSLGRFYASFVPLNLRYFEEINKSNENPRIVVVSLLPQKTSKRGYIKTLKGLVNYSMKKYYQMTSLFKEVLYEHQNRFSTLEQAAYAQVRTQMKKEE